jgi:GNAT superfamily N-acetyltransferase
MYLDYVKERTGKEYYETAYGFVIYSWYLTDAIYIEELYIKPDARLSGNGTKMVDAVCDLARAAGKKYLVGSVCPEAGDSTGSLKALLAYKMRLWKCEPGLIYLIKDL